jgi:hypothetical protein
MTVDQVTLCMNGSTMDLCRFSVAHGYLLSCNVLLKAGSRSPGRSEHMPFGQPDGPVSGMPSRHSRFKCLTQPLGTHFIPRRFAA